MSEAQSKSYYDEFSENYEAERHHGYHVLIDELEIEAAKDFCRGRVLEAGCGTGLILSRLAQITDVPPVGIDLSAGMLSVAQRRGLRIIQSSVDALPFANESFDTVVSFKVLAHVPNIEQALKELARITSSGGHLVLEFYNRNSLRGLIKRMKRPTTIGSTYNDEDVFTRLDTLDAIKGYLPPELELVDLRGVRVFTPLAQLHDIPLVGPSLAALEQRALRSNWLSKLAGFVVVVLRKL